MGANRLLLWLSARQQGSWSQFRSMVSDLGLDAGESDAEAVSPHQRLKFNLEVLGHVDFFGNESGFSWRVPPPVLAVSRGGNDIVGYLSGARTLPLVERLRQESGRDSWLETPAAGQPDVLRIRTTNETFLTQIGERTSVRLQWEAPICLLSCLDPINRSAIGHRKEMPFGRDVKIERFTIARRRYYWEATASNQPVTDGLYRCTRWQVPEYFLSLGGKTFTTSGQVGKYFLLHRAGRRVLRYNARERELTMPAICRPPLLIDRALTLCSGFPAAVRERHPGQPGMNLHYSQINPEVAGLAAEVLNQPLL